MISGHVEGEIIGRLLKDAYVPRARQGPHGQVNAHRCAPRSHQSGRFHLRLILLRQEASNTKHVAVNEEIGRKKC